MGDPRKLSRKFERPRIIWDKDRIVSEKALLREYGLKNMRELWGSAAKLRAIRQQARQYLALGAEGAATAQPMIARLKKYGLVGETATLDDLLGLTLRDVLERRLQTQVFKKGLARTVGQARQFIVHGFINVNGRKVSRPGYAVSVTEETKISYAKPINIDAGNFVKGSEVEETIADTRAAATGAETAETAGEVAGGEADGETAGEAAGESAEGIAVEAEAETSEEGTEKGAAE